MVNLDLVKFLVDNHNELLTQPLLGHLRDICSLYWVDQQYKRDSFTMSSFSKFLQDLDEIANVVPGSLVIQDQSTIYQEGERLEFIDVLSLELLHNRDKVVDVTKEKKIPRLENSVKQKPLFDRLMTSLDMDPGWNGKGLLRHTLLSQLQHSLSVEPVSFQLGRERAKETVPVSEYIAVCGNEKHAYLLSNSVHVINNKIVSMQWPKLSKGEANCPGLMTCLQRHIHYVPNVKPQTDLTLGDCSYLDTCHKLNSCRYIHYLQYIPEIAKENVAEKVKLANERILAQRQVAFYTHGNCCADVVKAQLPEQWIQCDVRKFDFDILGKFSAVIADPAWNIHMNLPYGTCNDIELLGLPLDQLQEEGILFLWVTGRAIDLGKDSLKKWGYSVVHEISWIKTNQLGRTIVTGRTGHWFNHSKEHLLVGLKGNPLWVNRHIDTDLIVSTTRETSRKPDELYGLIERLVGPHARKLEIFGRAHNVRPGWFTVGNQLSGSCIHELDVKRKYEEYCSNSQQSNLTNENIASQNVSHHTQHKKQQQQNKATRSRATQEENKSNRSRPYTPVRKIVSSYLSHQRPLYTRPIMTDNHNTRSSYIAALSSGIS